MYSCIIFLAYGNTIQLHVQFHIYAWPSWLDWTGMDYIEVEVAWEIYYYIP